MRRIPFRKSEANSHNPRRTCLRIRLGFHRTVGAYCETPQSALAGCQLPVQGRFWGAYPTSPERGGGPRVSVAEGFAVRRIPIGMHQGESVEALLASPGGVAERSESFNNNDCRWQSYLDLTAGRLDGSSEPARLTDEGRRQVKILFALRPVAPTQSYHRLPHHIQGNLSHGERFS